jgi:iron(III) transport system substrate-binding protein
MGRWDFRYVVAVLVVLGAVSLAALPFAGCRGSQPRVVLFCAQDQEFAEEILDDFKQRSGLPVVPKFDTEADKSVSLYVELIADRARPRCDVFWNNEILSTIRLQRQGLLEPYDSPSAAPYPDSAKASDHTWHAFAARARILLVNTRLVKEADRPRGLLELTDPRWKGKVAMARPQFGTTATQAACLFQVLGTDEAKRFYHGLRANGVQVAPGNKQVAEWVSDGRAAVGLTDTDDALEAVKDNSHVAIIFPDRDGLGTLFIPNTVAILRGSPNPDGARKLVDYLLSAEVEGKLAEGGSHQIPLNPGVKATLPPQMETPRTVKPMAVDFGKAADLWDVVQKFVAGEFERP